MHDTELLVWAVGICILTVLHGYLNQKHVLQKYPVIHRNAGWLIALWPASLTLAAVYWVATFLYTLGERVGQEPTKQEEASDDRR